MAKRAVSVGDIGAVDSPLHLKLPAPAMLFGLGLKDGGFPGNRKNSSKTSPGAELTLLNAAFPVIQRRQHGV